MAFPLQFRLNFATAVKLIMKIWFICRRKN